MTRPMATTSVSEHSFPTQNEIADSRCEGALKIDDVLSSKDDRSTFLKFNAQVKSDTNGEYKAEC